MFPRTPVGDLRWDPRPLHQHPRSPHPLASPARAPQPSDLRVPWSHGRALHSQGPFAFRRPSYLAPLRPAHGRPQADFGKETVSASPERSMAPYAPDTGRAAPSSHTVPAANRTPLAGRSSPFFTPPPRRAPIWWPRPHNPAALPNHLSTASCKPQSLGTCLPISSFPGLPGLYHGQRVQGRRTATWARPSLLQQDQGVTRDAGKPFRG